MSTASETREFRTLWSLILGQWNAVRPCWFAAALVLATCAAIIGAGQMRDILEYTIDRREGAWWILWPAFFLYFEAALLSVTAWSFTRAALTLHYPFTERAAEAKFLRRWLPAILGVAVPIAISIGFLLRAGAALNFNLLQGSFDAPSFAFAVKFFGNALGFALLAFGLLVLFAARRRVIEARFEQGKALGAGTHFWLFVLVAHGLILLVWFLAAPVGGPRTVGPGGIVLAAVASWIAVGTAFIMFISRRTGPPILAFLIVVAALFSLWNDNHAVRTIEAETADREPYEARVWRWLIERRTDILAERTQPYPVVFVSAEGGGLRAAYVAGAALAQLEDETQCRFSEHLFAASGVSGGSLGIAAFLAARADKRDELCDAPITQSAYQTSNRLLDLGRTRREASSFRDVVEDFLAQDHLSSALAGMLFVDLPLRFNPVPGANVPDRAWFIEKSWERGWRERSSDDADLFTRDVSAVADEAGPVGKAGPVVNFATVSVKSGRQWGVSNVDIDRRDWERRRDLIRVIDPAHADEPSRTVTLASAAHMSARFTYISPAGTVTWRDCVFEDSAGEPRMAEAANGACQRLSETSSDIKILKRRDRFVDGGYFENSGAAALERMMQDFENVVTITCADKQSFQRLMPENVRAALGPAMVRAARNLPCLSDRLDLTVLAINAQIGVFNADKRAAFAEDLETAEVVDGLFSETVSPLFAILSTRQARGRDAVEDLQFALEARRSRFEQGVTVADPVVYKNEMRQLAQSRTARVARTWRRNYEVDTRFATQFCTADQLKTQLEGGFHEVRLTFRRSEAERRQVPLGWLLSRSSTRTINTALRADCGLAGLSAVISRAN